MKLSALIFLFMLLVGCASFDSDPCFYTFSSEDKEGLANCLKAAEQDDAYAQGKLGAMYYHGYGVAEDATQAFQWWERSAEQGVPEAQYKLGNMYSKGRGGVLTDYKLAVYWWSKAAEQGEAWAQYKLGSMYADGKGVEKNPEQAVHWWSKAAEQGHDWAQYKLGKIYADEEGEMEDYLLAYMWFEIASSGGHVTASKGKEKLAAKMSKAEISEAMELAQEWSEKHK